MLGVYAAGSWVALEVVDVLGENLGLPDWFFGLALGLLVTGVPLALIVGLRRGSEGTMEDAGTDVRLQDAPRPATPRSVWRTAGVVGVGALALWGAVAAGWVIFGAADDELVEASIAVLPFENLGNSEHDYFASGVHDDILTQLSKIGALRVISRASVLRYRPGEKTAREIGDQLDVTTILEGTVRYDPDNNRVRLVVQLIDTSTDDHIWADRYDRTLDDVFEIQSELALTIARELRTALRPEEELRISDRRRPTTEAYDLILRGRELYGRGVRQNEAAIRYFRQATQEDPSSAEAWAELANAWGQQLQLGAATRDWADSMASFAERAVELDPELPLAYKALGFAYGMTARAADAVPAYERALELNPNYTTVMINLSGRHWNRGRCAEGIRLALQAHLLSPLNPWPAGHLGDHNACLGRIDETRHWLESARSIEPDWIWSDYFEATYLLGLGSIAEADSIAARFVASRPDERVALLVEAETAVFAGDHDGARSASGRLLELAPDWYFMAGSARAHANLVFTASGADGSEMAGLLSAIAREEERLRATPDSPYRIKALPILHAVAGNREDAILWLERAAELSGAAEIGSYARDPRLASIRDDARLSAAIEKARSRLAGELASVERWEAETDPYSSLRQAPPQ